MLTRKALNSSNFFLAGDGISFSLTGIYNSKYHIRLYKAKNMKPFFGLRAFNLVPKWVAGFRYFVECRQVLRIIVVHFENINMLFFVKLNPEFSS